MAGRSRATHSRGSPLRRRKAPFLGKAFRCECDYECLAGGATHHPAITLHMARSKTKCAATCAIHRHKPSHTYSTSS
eukprot:5987684-Prymnesium_polylepis.2